MLGSTLVHSGRFASPPTQGLRGARPVIEQEENFVSSCMVRSFLDSLRPLGCEPSELLLRCGLSSQWLACSDRIPMTDYLRLQRLAMRALGDEGLGALPGRQHLGTWAMICRSVIRCRDLGHALNRMFKHCALFDWSMDCRLSVDGEDCVIEIAPRPGVDFDHSLRAYEMVFSVTHYFASWLIQDCLPLKSISFVHPAPAYADDYRFLFQCDDLQFGQQRALLRFPSHWLDQPLRQNEVSLEPILANDCMDMVETVMHRTSWKKRLRSMLERNLAEMPEFEDVARQIGLHPQTLRRRLAWEHTTYKELKDEVRRAAALHYVERGGLSIEEVAEKVGFSEASAFIRAFRRWTAMTPHEYKQSHARFPLPAQC